MINEQIRDKEVRLIGEDGEQLGIVSAKEALKIAEDAGLDLVKIAPNAKPPVCKVIDYGKYRYELARKEKDAKKKQKTVPVYPLYIIRCVRWKRLLISLCLGVLKLSMSVVQVM